MSNDQDVLVISAFDVIDILCRKAQECRENGNTDMRNIIHTAQSLAEAIKSGKSKEEIFSKFVQEDE